MSIKFQCRLKLPYIIRLKEAKDYENDFIFQEFYLFRATFLFNDSKYESIYLQDYEPNSCQYIQIEIISNKFNYKNYRVQNRKIKNGSTTVEEEYFVNNVPEEVEMELMKDISPRVNEIIDFIKEKSGMFWLSPIPINPTSNMLGVFTGFCFYAPTAKLDKNMKQVTTTIDNYMESDSGVGGKKIYDGFFNDYTTYSRHKYRTSYQFLESAKTALYDLKLYEAIIFAAIAQESFISKYIEDNAPQSDIVFNKLNEINGNLMDLKYNAQLKYIKGKSLQEINSKYWNTILDIYRLRNAIMHYGEITTAHLKNIGFASINFVILKNALSNIEKTFESVNNL